MFWEFAGFAGIPACLPVAVGCTHSDAINPRRMAHRYSDGCRQVLEPVKHQLAGLARSLSGEPARQAKTAVHLVNSLLHQ